MAKVVDSNI